jgi:hypothetical protein
MDGSPTTDFTCGYWAHDVVEITVLDVTDLAAPAVTSEVYLPGSYVSARLIGDRVRFVTSDTLPFPDGGIRSARVADLPNWLATVEFPPYAMP